MLFSFVTKKNLVKPSVFSNHFRFYHRAEQHWQKYCKFIDKGLIPVEFGYTQKSFSLIHIL